MYSFRTNVSDVGNQQGVFSTIIEVVDMPNMPPMWVRAFASARFPEKEAQSFNVLAIDGDTGINADICYRLEFPLGDCENLNELLNCRSNYIIFTFVDSDIIAVIQTTGQIDVLPIDRDARQNELYSFEVKSLFLESFKNVYWYFEIKIFAYKCLTPTSFISGPAVLIVDDVNDNLPQIIFPVENTTIRIPEETFGTLLSTSELYVFDSDLGPHATYEVALQRGGEGAINFAEAFIIIPSSGYQNQTFAISVIDTNLIDYENENWQTFEIEVRLKVYYCVLKF